MSDLKSRDIREGKIGKGQGRGGEEWGWWNKYGTKDSLRRFHEEY